MGLNTARLKTDPSQMRARRVLLWLVFICLLTFSRTASADSLERSSSVAVGPQYDTAHVYVAPDDFDTFVTSLLATFGGTATKQGVFTVTPTPSVTMSQLVLTPVGTISVFGFKSPIPYPFGIERTGYLVTDLDAAVRAARESGADLVVAPFADPIGRDAIVAWPGGVHMQLYWHTQAPAYSELRTIPENRVYVSPDSVDDFVTAFVEFSHGEIVSDDPQGPGSEIGEPGAAVRQIRLDSRFGKFVVFVTNGQLPYPFGRELFGYEVGDLAETLRKATEAGARVLVRPYVAGSRHAAMVQFPGGYIAEIHTLQDR